MWRFNNFLFAVSLWIGSAMTPVSSSPEKQPSAIQATINKAWDKIWGLLKWEDASISFWDLDVLSVKGSVLNIDKVAWIKEVSKVGAHNQMSIEAYDKITNTVASKLIDSPSQENVRFILENTSTHFIKEILQKLDHANIDTKTLVRIAGFISLNLVNEQGSKLEANKVKNLVLYITNWWSGKFFSIAQNILNNHTKQAAITLQDIEKYTALSESQLGIILSVWKSEDIIKALNWINSIAQIIWDPESKNIFGWYASIIARKPEHFEEVRKVITDTPGFFFDIVRQEIWIAPLVNKQGEVPWDMKSPWKKAETYKKWKKRVSTKREKAEPAIKIADNWEKKRTRKKKIT